MTNLKGALRSLPLIGPTFRGVYHRLFAKNRIVFHRSGQYWEDQYRFGGISESGSYGRPAQLKADILNEFVLENSIDTIVKFGCDDGAQLTQAKYPSYVGFDFAPASINLCRERFIENSAFSFHMVGSEAFEYLKPVDLALSLGIIYHLIEDDVFESYMKKLFGSASRLVIIYAYDFDKEYTGKHEKGRKFTNLILDSAPNWKLIKKIPNNYPYDLSNPNDSSLSKFFVYKKDE